MKMSDTSLGCERISGLNDMLPGGKNSGQLLLGGMADDHNDSETCGNYLPSGFLNVGNTCFLASATQVLVTIPSIERLVQACYFKEITPESISQSPPQATFSYSPPQPKFRNPPPSTPTWNSSSPAKILSHPPTQMFLFFSVREGVSASKFAIFC